MTPSSARSGVWVVTKAKFSSNNPGTLEHLYFTIRPPSSSEHHYNMGNQQATEEPKVQPKVGKSGKKICCSCPDTKKLRDACTLENGPESDLCKELIEKHKECLRGEGFIVK